jgi:hypothetical protein
MLKAAMAARNAHFIGDDKRIELILEAALRWLSENPIVPTEKQERKLDDAWMESKKDLASRYYKCAHATEFGAIEWQRMMFLEPEPEVPEEIKDLIAGVHPDVAPIAIEAFRRGQKAGEK